jgi:hypothetical protein
MFETSYVCMYEKALTGIGYSVKDSYIHPKFAIDMAVKNEKSSQGVTKICRLSWLTNSALVYEPKCGGRGRVAGTQPMSTALHRSPNKLWISNSIFNL